MTMSVKMFDCDGDGIAVIYTDDITMSKSLVELALTLEFQADELPAGDDNIALRAAAVILRGISDAAICKSAYGHVFVSDDVEQDEDGEPDYSREVLAPTHAP